VWVLSVSGVVAAEALSFYYCYSANFYNNTWLDVMNELKSFQQCSHSALFINVTLI